MTMERLTRIWDLPIRMFHWVLALLVIFSIITIHLGGNWVEWHMRSGYGILALLGFRYVWGFAGGRYARFSSFIPSWRNAKSGMRTLASRRRTQFVGHGPIGAFSVWVMLLALTLQALTGLFSNDDIA